MLNNFLFDIFESFNQFTSELLLKLFQLNEAHIKYLKIILFLFLFLFLYSHINLTFIQLTLKLTLCHRPGRPFTHFFLLLLKNRSKLIPSSLIKLLLILLLFNHIEILLTFSLSNFLLPPNQLFLLTLTLLNLLMKNLQVLNVFPDTNLSTLDPFLTHFFYSLFTLLSSH